MDFDVVILVFYGMFLLVGAYLGWKRGSKVSLIMGSTFGAIVLGGAFFVSSNPRMGFTLEAILAGLLSFAFFMRLMKTRTFMPAGMLLGISLVILVFCISKLVAA